MVDNGEKNIVITEEAFEIIVDALFAGRQFRFHLLN